MSLLGIFLLLLPLLQTLPINQSNNDLVELIRSGTKKLVDVRSNVAREVSGYLEGSILASEFHDERPEIDIENVIFIVGEEKNVADEICSENVLCYQGSLKPFSDIITFPRSVSFTALSVLLEENKIVLVDVRNTSELISPGMIPGSFNVPLHEIPEAFLLEPDQFLAKYKFPLPNKDAQNVVLTCRSGRRVKVAIKRLEPSGFTNLRSYDGSFNDWKKKGGKIVVG